MNETPEGRYARVNGLEMYYEESGSGPPLILLHGGTVTSEMWAPYLPAFTRHFRVIAPDSRGHGRTNNPAGALSYRAMADDVAALVQALNLDHPYICGYSDGGNIALEIGMRYPHLATALVVGAAWHRLTEGYLDALRAFGMTGPGQVEFEALRDAAPDLVALWEAEHTWSADPDYWQMLLTQIATLWWTPLDYRDADFQAITDPALILMGDRDDMIDLEQAIELYQRIPGAELAILPGRGHNPSPEEGKLLTDVVLDFLLRHAAAENEKAVSAV